MKALSNLLTQYYKIKIMANFKIFSGAIAPVGGFNNSLQLPGIVLSVDQASKQGQNILLNIAYKYVNNADTKDVTETDSSTSSIDLDVDLMHYLDNDFIGYLNNSLSGIFLKLKNLSVDYTTTGSSATLQKSFDSSVYVAMNKDNYSDRITVGLTSFSFDLPGDIIIKADVDAVYKPIFGSEEIIDTISQKNIITIKNIP